MPAEPRPPADAFVHFCECLNRFDVDYVVVGSEAVAFHGAPRYSADFDTFVRATRANLFRVLAALEVFGAADLAGALDPETWAKTGATVRLGTPPLQVDVLLQLSGTPYDRAAAGAVAGQYGTVAVRFIGLQDLLTNKRAAGRPKDLADVAALEAAAR
jgi:uncharacterized nucleotidyltransferase DUF6036